MPDKHGELEGTVVAAPPEDDELEELEDDASEVVVDDDLVFTTKVKDRTGSEVGKELPFEIDGEVYTAIRPPDEAFMFLTTAAARSTPTAEKMHAMIEFIGEATTEETGVRLRDRLLDPDDDFGFTDLLPILELLVKKWQGGKKRPRHARNRRRR